MSAECTCFVTACNGMKALHISFERSLITPCTFIMRRLFSAPVSNSTLCSSWLRSCTHVSNIMKTSVSGDRTMIDLSPVNSSEACYRWSRKFFYFRQLSPFWEKKPNLVRWSFRVTHKTLLLYWAFRFPSLNQEGFRDASSCSFWWLCGVVFVSIGHDIYSLTFREHFVCLFMKCSRQARENL